MNDAMKDYMGDLPSRMIIKKSKKMGIDLGNMLCDLHVCWYTSIDKRAPRMWYNSKCKLCKEK